MTWSLSSSPLGPSSSLASSQPLEASPQMLSSLRSSPPLASSPPMEASPPFRSHSEICELSSQVKQSEKVAAACIEEFIANNDSEVIEPEKTKAIPAEVPKQFKVWFRMIINNQLSDIILMLHGPRAKMAMIFFLIQVTHTK